MGFSKLTFYTLNIEGGWNLVEVEVMLCWDKILT